MLKGFFYFCCTVFVALLGGYLFDLLNVPLPYILGAITFIVLWKSVIRRDVLLPDIFKQFGFIILGINFGSRFTLETFRVVGTYIIPFVLLTVILLFVCVTIGLSISKRYHIDRVTSVFSCIPGGLPEMTEASKAVGGNPSYVAIYQTIRMITVLFTVPLIVSYFFKEEPTVLTNHIETLRPEIHWLHYSWYLVPLIFALFLQHRIPAGIIIGALGVTAGIKVLSIPIPDVPYLMLILAQIMVGISIGKNISFEHLKKSGKYGFVYLGSSIVIIITSLILGILLSYFTSLNLQTAILSLSPGGLFEMVLTANEVGGDPTVVSALQLIRVLMIVIFVPSILNWYFSRGNQRSSIEQK